MCGSQTNLMCGISLLLPCVVMPPLLLPLRSLLQPQMPLQKLLFSATLTQNPEKLQQLGLYRPRLFSSTHRGPASDNDSAQPEEKFIFPPGLTVRVCGGPPDRAVFRLYPPVSFYICSLVLNLLKFNFLV